MKSASERIAERKLKTEAFLTNRLPSRRDAAYTFSFGESRLYFHELNKKEVLVIIFRDFEEEIQHRTFDAIIARYDNLYQWHKRFPKVRQVIQHDLELKDLWFIDGLIDDLEL